MIKRIEPLVYSRLRNRKEGPSSPEYIIGAGKLNFGSLSNSTRLHMLSVLFGCLTNSPNSCSNIANDTLKSDKDDLAIPMRCLIALEKSRVHLPLSTIGSIVFPKRDDIFIFRFLKNELLKQDLLHKKATHKVILHYINLYFSNHKLFSRVLHFLSGESECIRFVNALFAAYNHNYPNVPIPEHGLLE